MRKRVGARYLGNGTTRFRVWAPFRSNVDVRLDGSNLRETRALTLEGNGYWSTDISGTQPGDRYSLVLDGEIVRPDPASRYQPETVHGPSEVVDTSFPWSDGTWGGLPLEDLIFYEIHPGTFTPEGTLRAIIPRLNELAAMGITCLSLMPAAQFPGSRNWGYDGVLPFAVQNTYGGPRALRELVDACHARGLAVVLDVVYNHLGPEGNYLADFGPYFTEQYATPWGPALNFDSAHSDEVRNFFMDNALTWIEDFHLDGLRLDAVHAIFDMSARPFLQELASEVRRLGRRLGKPVHLLPESDANDARLIREQSLGGLGHSGQWADDFHHSVHALLTGERQGYYLDFGSAWQLKKALAQGYVYDGIHSAYRRRRHGNSPRDRSGKQFVVSTQNHDQVGNRMQGERLSALVSLEADKLAAGLLLTSPFLPLIFMGQEYGETAPFRFFVSHGDDWLIEAVREGRKREFAAFDWPGEPPDPQDPETFAGCVLSWHKRNEGKHRSMAGLYAALIRMRKSLPALRELRLDRLAVWGANSGAVLSLLRWSPEDRIAAVCNLTPDEEEVRLDLPGTGWTRLLHTADREWDGPGSAIPNHPEPDGGIRLAGYSLVLLRSVSR